MLDIPASFSFRYFVIASYCVGELITCVELIMRFCSPAGNFESEYETKESFVEWDIP